jgi:hypothetical protein
VPFSIVGSNTLLEVNGKRVRGRLYPWGVVEVENKDHCDFVKLRNMLIRLATLTGFTQTNITHTTPHYPDSLGYLTCHTHWVTHTCQVTCNISAVVLVTVSENVWNLKHDFPGPTCKT